MGNTCQGPTQKPNQKGKTILYSVPVTNQQQQLNCTPIYRNPHSQNFLYSYLHHENNLQYLFQLSFLQRNKDQNHCIAFYDNNIQKFEYLSYQKVYQISQEVGSALLKMGVLEFNQQIEGKSMQIIGIYSKNRYELLILDIVAGLYNFTNVPFKTNHSILDIAYILKDTNLKCLFVSIDELNYINTLGKQYLGTLKTIVCLDENIDESLRQSIESKFNFYTFKGIRKNSTDPKNFYNLPKIRSDDIFTINYTNTYNEKYLGAMLSHENILSSITAIKNNLSILPQKTDYVLNHLPYDHLKLRIYNYITIYQGGCVGYIDQPQQYEFNVKLTQKQKFDNFQQNFIKKVQLFQPTILFTVPMILQSIFHHLESRIEEKSQFMKNLIEQGIQTKINNIKMNKEETSHFLHDKFTFSDFNQILGNKMRLSIVSSAPITSYLLDLLKVILQIPIIEVYGQTEASGFISCTQPFENQHGQIGGILTNQEFKLLDIPELEYKTNQTSLLGNTIQRGEILIRGSNVFQGYYNNIYDTKIKLDKNGWLHTGDIGELQIDNSLQIIDRINQDNKTCNGKFTHVYKIEHYLSQIEEIDEVYVYGSPFFRYLVAIIRPSQKFVEIINNETDSYINNTKQDQYERKKLMLQIIKDCQQEMYKEKLIFENQFVENIILYENQGGMVDQIMEHINYIEEQKPNQQFSHKGRENLKRFLLRKKYQQELDTLYPCVPPCQGDLNESQEMPQFQAQGFQYKNQTSSNLCQNCKIHYQENNI